MSQADSFAAGPREPSWTRKTETPRRPGDEEGRIKEEREEGRRDRGEEKERGKEGRKQGEGEGKGGRKRLVY